MKKKMLENIGRISLFKNKLVQIFGVLSIAIGGFCIAIAVDRAPFFFLIIPFFLLIIVILLTPLMGIYLLLIFGLFEKFEWEVMGMTVRPGQIMVSILFLVWLIWIALGKNKIHGTPVTLPIIGYILINIISSLINSPLLRRSLQSCLLIMVTTLFYFVLVNLLLDRPHYLKKTIFIFLLLGVLQALYGIISVPLYLRGIKIGGVIEQVGGRIAGRGTFLEANLFGSYTATIGLCLLPYFLSTYFRKWRIWIGIALAITTMGLILSWTRAAWIAFIVGAVVSLVLLRRWKTMTIMKAVGLLIIVFLAFQVILGSKVSEISGFSGNMYIHKLRNLFNFQSGTGAYRIKHTWLPALINWQNHPILGNGTDSIKIYGKTAWIGSSIIQALHDTGIIGLAILIWLLGKTFFTGLSALSKTENEFFRINLVAMLASFVGLCIAYQAATALWMGFAWIHLAIMMAMAKISMKERDISIRG